MTHTLHRQGTKESLAHDFIIHSIPAQGFNNQGSKPKLQGFLNIARKYNPVNTGESSLGNQYCLNPDELHDKLKTITHAVFTNEEVLTSVLKDLKEADFGMSITLSGLSDKLFSCCANAGIKPFAVEHSLGVLGNKAGLPDEHVMQITTMCGHSMLSQGLVRKIVQRIKKGQLTAAEAGIELAKPCQCGIFNPVRAAELLEEFCALHNVSVK